MIRPPTEIRSATPGEMSHAVAAIVAAFLTDPLARFAWPSPHNYLRGMALGTREFAGGSFEHDTAYVSADFCGAALWLPPGVHPNGEALERVFRDTAEPEHLDDLLGTFEKMEQWHPEEPHWYLPIIGVEPNAQGKGLGAELMRHAVMRPRESARLPRVVEPAEHLALPAPRFQGYGGDPGRCGTARHADAPAAALMERSVVNPPNRSAAGRSWRTISGCCSNLVGSRVPDSRAAR